MALPQREAISVPGGEIADVEPGPGEARELGDLPLAQEALRDAALIEDLDGPRVQSAGPRTDELLIRAPLDHGDVDIRERQLGGQHQTGRAAAGDHARHGDSRGWRRPAWYGRAAGTTEAIQACGPPRVAALDAHWGGGSTAGRGT